MQPTHKERPRIANSLILRIGLLILASLAVFAAASYSLILQPTVGSLAEAQMGLVSEQLEARVARLLQTVEATLRSSRGWGMDGDLDHARLLRFNEFFFAGGSRRVGRPVFGHGAEQLARRPQRQDSHADQPIQQASAVAHQRPCGP